MPASLIKNDDKLWWQLVLPDQECQPISMQEAEAQASMTEK